jgi:hypothetical protein
MMHKHDMFEAVRLILVRDWDPIGIGGEPAAADEYDGYAAAIVSMIGAGTQTEGLANYLLSVERDRMQFPGDAARSVRVAAQLRGIRR